jgi:membrane protein YqaA with SNARE-associated domain
VTPYLLLVLAVFGVNLLPAFGPPTWSVLVFFRLHWHLDSVATVALGAFAAASGRYVLALGARRFRLRLSAKRRTSLEALDAVLARHRVKSVAGLLLFAISPIPSAPLFVGAGLLDVALLPLVAAFFAGRIVSYSFFVTAASGADGGLGPVVQSWFRSPVGIGIEVALVLGVVLLLRVDWAGVVARAAKRREAKRGDVSGEAGAPPPSAEGPPRADGTTGVRTSPSPTTDPRARA